VKRIYVYTHIYPSHVGIVDTQIYLLWYKLDIVDVSGVNKANQKTNQSNQSNAKYVSNTFQ